MAVKPNLPSVKSPRNEGQMKGNAQMDKFADPREAYPPNIIGMESLRDDIGEKSGFQTDGYINKKGTPYGESAKFNMLPPGMDITNQENCDIRNMELMTLTDVSYPGDGWEPAPRDVKEI